ncbi:MAG: hypothetical protein AMXMBFR83_15000 [Phycisphaerae bacterium]
MQRMSGVGLGIGAVLVLGVGSPSALAIVTTLQATVSSEVRQTVDGATVNGDSAFDALDVTTFRLPLMASSRLFVEGGEPAASAVGKVAAAATAQFSDPRINQNDTPNEFSLDVIGFSDTPESVVTGQGLSTETREIIFRAEDVSLASGTAVEARSFFFLDGILLLLAKPGHSDLSGAVSRLSIRVVQQRAEAEPATVLDATVTLTGNADGSATLAVDGALVPENVTTFGLTSGGLIDGTLQAVVLPGLAIPYVYPANVDETFTLRAEISTSFEAGPGTGAAGILGDAVGDLVALIEDALGEDLADDFTGGLGLGLAGAPAPSARLIADSTATTLKVVGNSRGISLLPNCGLFGVEAALAAFGWLGLASCRRRRPPHDPAASL